jgi:hypothetical protein
MCQPVQIAGPFSQTFAIGLAPPGVVISADKDISRCDAPGGCSAATLKTLATGYNQLGDVVVSGDHFFWTASFGDYYRLLTCPLTGCPADIPESSPNVVENVVNESLSRIVAGPNHLVWARRGYNGPYLQSCTLPACSVHQTVRPEPPDQTDPGREMTNPITVMAVSATKVFYATNIYNAGARVRACGLGGVCSSPTNIETGAFALAYFDGKLYGATSATTGSGNVIFTVADGTTTTNPVAADAAGISSLAIDASGIYWSNALTGKIQRCPLAGCSGGELLAGGQTGADRIQVDDKFVYWKAGNVVMRVAK